MALTVIPLSNLLTISSGEEINKLLSSFTCNSLLKGSSDVEQFLHTKAIQFENLALSRTYLVMASYQSKPYLAGYFSISNKSLVVPKKQFSSMSNSLKKKLMGLGYKTEMANYEIKGILLGQLGKNYSEEAIKAKGITGDELLALAYQKIREAYIIIGGRILFLECEDHPKIKGFYSRNGFKELDNYESQNNFCLFLKNLKDV